MFGRTQLRWLAVSSQIFLVCAALFWPGVARAATQSRLVFGQERFTRSTGAPDTQSRQFTVPAYVTAPFTLDIINGNPGSGNGAIPDAVSSASLILDGHEVVAEREFSKTTPRITKEISLTAGAHSLEVRLNSAPDSYIRVSIGGVIALGDLTQPRSGHTAILLADNSVLFAGGMSNSTAQRTAERFDVATLKATALTAPLAAARSDHAAALLPQRDALLTGGSDAAGPIPSAELYRAASATFSAIGASLPIARAGQSATLLLDGSVLILGGHGVAGSAINQSESFDPNHDPLTGALFNPINGAFKLLPHALSVARSNHAATLLPSGQILVAGGRNDTGLISSAELFDPATGRSMLLPSSLNTARAEHSATLRSDGSVVIAGGVGGAGILDSIEVYAPQSQSFAALATKLIAARRSHTATLLSIGEILIAGGEDASGTLAHTELIGPAETDSGAPQVMAIAPANGSVGADLNGIVAIRFSEPVNVSSLTAANVRLSVAGQPIPAIVSAGESGLYAFIVPNALLAAGTIHTVSLENVHDLGGNALPSTSWSFTTVAAPSIASFSPVHGPKGTSVRVVGSAFDPTGPPRNIVTLGSTAVSVAAVDATSLTFAVPSNASIGAQKISIRTRGGATISADDFTVDNPVPILTSISPTQARGGAAVSLIAGGADFVPGAVVYFGTTPLATSFVSAASLSAQIPAAPLASAGTFAVRVFNPAPGGGFSAGINFTVLPNNASLGDFVWNDLNDNGIQDAGEPGIGGVTRIAY